MEDNYYKVCNSYICPFPYNNKEILSKFLCIKLENNFSTYGITQTLQIVYKNFANI